MPMRLPCFPTCFRMDPTLTVKGGKRNKEHLTILLCCNIDGSEKINPLTIGKSKNQRVFKGHTMLPCQYDFNKKTWITLGIFTSWVYVFISCMRCSNHSVMFFMGNCPAHPQIQNLTNVKLVLLPPNIATLQPLDQSIIKALKVYFSNK
ncbi:hypothetical protein PR048_028172 [Dryococelus australis]|uniref:DDE-1 domain-containing protein n=1 Tax=Dryococelus australis TaxID=614101 RepID=A0ABQ9GIH1_9NEOP|nr:hypothetical protein PR048_028172 [Dryococelus australis]